MRVLTHLHDEWDGLNWQLGGVHNNFILLELEARRSHELPLARLGEAMSGGSNFNGEGKMGVLIGCLELERVGGCQFQLEPTLLKDKVVGTLFSNFNLIHTKQHISKRNKLVKVNKRIDLL